MKKEKDNKPIVEPIIIQKIYNKTKEKKFDIEKIFDKDHKPGKEVKMAKKEKKTAEETMLTSFEIRKEAKNNKFKKYLPFG